MSNDSIENQTNFHFAIGLYRFLPISILLLDPSIVLGKKESPPRKSTSEKERNEPGRP